MDTISGKQHSKSSTPLTALALQLKSWRSTRRRGQRIPHGLWAEAVRLGHRHGVSTVSTALKLNYYDLQRRLGIPTPQRSPRLQPAQFVALPPMALGQSTEAGTLELTRANGSRLILRLPITQTSELVPLVEAFLRS